MSLVGKKLLVPVEITGACALRDYWATKPSGVLMVLSPEDIDASRPADFDPAAPSLSVEHPGDGHKLFAIYPDGRVEVAPEYRERLDDLGREFFEALTRAWPAFLARPWLPMDTAPLDGTEVDLIRNGERLTNYYWSPVYNAWTCDVGYPVRYNVLTSPPDGWMPKPVMDPPASSPDSEPVAAP